MCWDIIPQKKWNGIAFLRRIKAEIPRITCMHFMACVFLFELFTVRSFFKWYGVNQKKLQYWLPTVAKIGLLWRNVTGVRLTLLVLVDYPRWNGMGESHLDVLYSGLMMPLPQASPKLLMHRVVKCRPRCSYQVLFIKTLASWDVKRGVLPRLITADDPLLSM